MEVLFTVLAFLGMFAAGFFACMLLVFLVVMYTQDKEMKRKNRDNGGDGHERCDYRNKHRS